MPDIDYKAEVLKKFPHSKYTYYNDYGNGIYTFGAAPKIGADLWLSKNVDNEDDAWLKAYDTIESCISYSALVKEKHPTYINKEINLYSKTAAEIIRYYIYDTTTNQVISKYHESGREAWKEVYNMDQIQAAEILEFAKIVKLAYPDTKCLPTNDTTGDYYIFNESSGARISRFAGSVHEAWKSAVERLAVNPKTATNTISPAKKLVTKYVSSAYCSSVVDKNGGSYVVHFNGKAGPECTDEETAWVKVAKSEEFFKLVVSKHIQTMNIAINEIHNEINAIEISKPVEILPSEPEHPPVDIRIEPRDW